MKKNVVMLAATLLLFGAGTARAQIGVAAGLDFQRFGDLRDASGQTTTLERASGWHVGVFVDLETPFVALRPGVFYRDVGKVEWEGLIVDDFDLSLIEVPIDVRFNVLTAPVVSPYVAVAPVLTFAQPEERLKDAFQDLSVSGAVALGVEVNLPVVGLTLFPEIRYSFGLSRFVKDSFTVGGVDVEIDEAPKPTNVAIRLGVGF